MACQKKVLIPLMAIVIILRISTIGCVGYQMV
uniref:Uncharacterized protein n=1 Tax=Arundo donax TaxID=35708 RepID=A0A0A9CJF4_ARUDO